LLCLLAMHPPETRQKSEILRSAAGQAEFLARHLEWDVGGNHLLENARALIFAGRAIDSPHAEGWLHRGLEIIRRELPIQVLPHGEHFERSPMYHQEMLELLHEVGQLTGDYDQEFSAKCRRTVAAMREFRESLLHPDGDVPQLGDTVLSVGAPAGPAASAHGAAALAGPMDPAPRSAARDGYWTFRCGGDFLLLDAAPVGPDHLPAHAHADLLTIEASLDGARWIVDAGVFDYEDGAMRAYCRSTAAHNVLEVDGQNQCDVWGRFRMGARGWPAPLQSGKWATARWAGAVHNAYRRLGVPVVGRFVCCRPDEWLIVDWALGAGRRRLVNRLHLHPECRVAARDGVELQLARGPTRVWLRALGAGAMRTVPGWWSPRWGERFENCVIEHEQSTELPAVVGWQLSRQPAITPPRVTMTARTLRIDGTTVAGEGLIVDIATGRVGLNGPCAPDAVDCE
jgi:uncharacterized heparinase superfamily protein